MDGDITPIVIIPPPVVPDPEEPELSRDSREDADLIDGDALVAEAHERAREEAEVERLANRRGRGPNKAHNPDTLPPILTGQAGKRENYIPQRDRLPQQDHTPPHGSASDVSLSDMPPTQAAPEPAPHQTERHPNSHPGLAGRKSGVGQNGPNSRQQQNLLRQAHDPLVPSDVYQKALKKAGLTQAEAKRRALAIGRIYVPHIMDNLCRLAVGSRDERVKTAASQIVLDRILGKPKEAPPDVDENQQKKLDLRKLLKACDDEELETLKGLFKKIAKMQAKAAEEQEAQQPVTEQEEADGVEDTQEDTEDTPEGATAPGEPDLGHNYNLAESVTQGRVPVAGMGPDVYSPDEVTPAEAENYGDDNLDDETEESDAEES